MNSNNQKDKSSRLLDIIGMLQSGMAYDAGRISEELGVSRRTIFRDIKLLNALGIQIEYNESSKLYEIINNLNIPKNIEIDELKALIISMQLSLASSESTLHSLANSAIRKILNFQDDNTKIQIENLLNSFSFEKNESYFREDVKSVLRTSIEAISQKQKIRTTYLDGSRDYSTTLISPYQVFVSSEDWKLIGRSSVHRKTCTFDMNRIQALDIVDAKFNPISFRYSANNLPFHVTY